MSEYGPLGLTLTKPDAFNSDDLRGLVKDLNMIWREGAANIAVGGPAHWMMIDIINAVEEALAKTEDA